MIVESKLNEVKSSVLLGNEDLLFLVKHPSEGGNFGIQRKSLFAEPFPVASIHDKERLSSCSLMSTEKSKQG